MFDPITLEVMRCKLEAIADDGAKTVIRTAISPAVADAGDCSCAIYAVNGDLIVGGGPVFSHYHTGVNGVHAITALHGDGIADGDIFLVNDPYSGGGYHAQDVFIHIPIFVDGQLSAWVGSSAHMMDMGGSVLGSFSPTATECYQESIRFPPVRLYRRGEEQNDIWAIFRNNIRMSSLVEMDVRALIAGSNVICRHMKSFIAEYGRETFAGAVSTLADLTEQDFRRRIMLIEPGTYEAISWSEWTDELFRIPCKVTVANGHIVFDYRGASPQCDHYINSKPYVIQSLLASALKSMIANDLPLNEGIFRTFELICEPGSILDASPPAPIGAPHLDVGQNAVEVAMRAINLAVAASPSSPARKNMAGPSSGSAFALHTLSGIGLLGKTDGWLVLDGSYVGASAGSARDTPDLWYENTGPGTATEHIDIEVIESWYPVEVEHRGPRLGMGGAGKYKAGAGARMRYRVSGTKELSITIMGNRESVPIGGMAGGLPGSLTDFQILRADGSQQPQPCHVQGVQLLEGDGIEFKCANGGGWGDPLDRDQKAVEADVRHGRLTAEEARDGYGVVIGDEAATTACRKNRLRERLSMAQTAKRPLTWTDDLRAITANAESFPLSFGIVQTDVLALSERSGALLAVSPSHWTDGCPTIRNFLPGRKGTEITAYLDPATGHLMHVDVTAEAVERAFETSPRRWTEAAHASLHEYQRVAAE